MDLDDSGLLEPFGVSKNAEAVWRVLLANPQASLSDLASATDLSAAQVEAAVSTLDETQFARRSALPAGITIIEVGLTLDTQIARVERHLAEQAEHFAALRALIPALVGTYARGRNTGDDRQVFEIVVPIDDIRRQAYFAGEGAKTETRSLLHSMTIEGMRDAQPRDLDMVARGLRCRTIVSPTQLDDPDFYAALEQLHAGGEQFRTLPELPTRLQIYDRSLAVLMVDASDLSRGAMFIRARNLVDLLVLLFDYMWSIADPIFTSSTDPAAPTGRLARTLELMAIGMKDGRIARALGVDVRTVRRYVAELKRLLGVSTRVQVIAEAVRRGWV